jgi:hypothetical protein
MTRRLRWSGFLGGHLTHTTPFTEQYAVISDSLLNIDQALVDNDAVRQSFRTVHDSTLAQYEADLAQWDKEIAK